MAIAGLLVERLLDLGSNRVRILYQRVGEIVRAQRFWQLAFRSLHMIGGYRVVLCPCFLRRTGTGRHRNKSERQGCTEKNERAPHFSDSMHTLIPKTAS